MKPQRVSTTNNVRATLPSCHMSSVVSVGANSFSTVQGEMLGAPINEVNNNSRDSNSAANSFDNEMFSQGSWADSIIYAASDDSSASMTDVYSHIPRPLSQATSTELTPTDYQQTDNPELTPLTPFHTSSASSQILFTAQIHEAPPGSQSACSSSSAPSHQLQSGPAAATLTSSQFNSSLSQSIPPTPPETPLEPANSSASSYFQFQANTPPSFQGQSNHFTAPTNVASMHEVRVAETAVPVFSPWIPPASPTGVEPKTCYSKYAANANKKSDPVETSIIALSKTLEL